MTPRSARDLRRSRCDLVRLPPRSRRARPWLFGDFSIADAMFAPVALRVGPTGSRCLRSRRATYDTMLRDPHLLEWIAASCANTQVIPHEEAGAGCLTASPA
jgi:glutathione S-transferase